MVAFFNIAVGTEYDHTDIVGFEVQRHAADAAGKFHHLTGLHLVEAVDTAPSDEGEIDLELDDDSPDVVENGQIDLGQYAVEQLALHLDPYPRKDGAVFEQPPEPGEISPFGVLRALKPNDGDKS